MPDEMANGYDIDLTLFIDGERIGAAGRATHGVVNPGAVAEKIPGANRIHYFVVR